MDRAVLKSKAKQQIKGNLGILFGITLLMVVISFALNLIPYIGSIANAVCMIAFSFSLVMIYLGITDGVKAKVGDMFKGFNQVWPAIKLYLLMGIKIMLWSLLLYIPGIVKAYAYSMAPYILAENPGMGAREAIRRSKEMTEGHKMDLFILDLSFIGWGLLAPFTLGLLCIWLIPYMSATKTNAYKSLKGTPAVEASTVDFGFDSDATDFGGEEFGGNSGNAAPAAAPAASGSTGGDDMFSAADMDEINKLSEIL